MRKAVGASVATAVMISGGVTSASASGGVASDPLNTLLAAFPAGITDNPAEGDLDIRGDSPSARTAGGGSHSITRHVNPEDAHMAPEELAENQAVSNLSFEVTLGSEFSRVPHEGNQAIFEDAAGRLDVVAQPLSTGMAIFTVIDDRNASAVSFGVDAPEGTEGVSRDDGVTTLTQPDGLMYTAVDKPTVVDANGRTVDAASAWDNGELVTTFTSDENTVFPLVARSELAYQQGWYIANGSDPWRIDDTLKRCFNCYFPVPGAPRAFPSHGQTVNLTPFGQPFPVTFSDYYREYFNPHWYMGFTFIGNEGHVQGRNSTVHFYFDPFWNYSGHLNDVRAMLTVVAFKGENAANFPPSWAVSAGAITNWTLFAYNLHDIPNRG